MRAIYYEKFGGEISIKTLDDPVPSEDSVIVKVHASGICRSDWHGWQGHDPDIVLPHVPGHELAGTVVEAGKRITRWAKGDRVTVPFVGGCGRCPVCQSGNHQICGSQFQPGFTDWGSFAELVEIKYADTNLIALPESIDFVTAASLGCRFVTSFRAVIDQGRVKGGQFVAVFGCGGIGLSAVMIATAVGATVIAVDINEETLQLAKKLGAAYTLNPRNIDDIPEAILEITQGGVDVSLDALGSTETCLDSIASLKRQGKHIQVGLLVGDDSAPAIPMAPVIGKELEIIGSHGMQAFRYEEVFRMIQMGQLAPEKMLGKTITLEEAIPQIKKMDKEPGVGISVITEF